MLQSLSPSHINICHTEFLVPFWYIKFFLSHYQIIGIGVLHWAPLLVCKIVPLLKSAPLFWWQMLRSWPHNQNENICDKANIKKMLNREAILFVNMTYHWEIQQRNPCSTHIMKERILDHNFNQKSKDF